MDAEETVKEYSKMMKVDTKLMNMTLSKEVIRRRKFMKYLQKNSRTLAHFLHLRVYNAICNRDTKQEKRRKKL